MSRRGILPTGFYDTVTRQSSTASTPETWRGIIEDEGMLCKRIARAQALLIARLELAGEGGDDA